MNISEAAKRSGVSVKMIRHYEAIGLLPAAPRTEAGYRYYNDNDAGTLRFIRAARDLGFGLDAVRELLSLWQNRSRTSREVKALALAHISALEDKVAELNGMISTLRRLATHCHGDHRPDCPILDGLSNKAGKVAGAVTQLPRGERSCTTMLRNHE
jgi:MerR family copper efflux transcriptional regulator